MFAPSASRYATCKVANASIVYYRSTGAGELAMRHCSVSSYFGATEQVIALLNLLWDWLKSPNTSVS